MRPHGSTPSTYVLKLPLGLVGHRLAGFRSSVENESLCMSLLAELGLPAAKTETLQFGSQKVLSVARFDRQLHSSGHWFMRLPQEDFRQVKVMPSRLKYETDGGPSVADLAVVLQGSIQAKQDLTTLLTTQLLFWMLAAPDGHAKNFSLRILPQGRYALTPLYDVMSIWPVQGNGPNQFSMFKAKMAMAVLGKNRHYLFKDIQRKHFNTMAAKCFQRVDQRMSLGQYWREFPRPSMPWPADFQPAFLSGLRSPFLRDSAAQQHFWNGCQKHERNSTPSANQVATLKGMVQVK